MRPDVKRRLEENLHTMDIALTGNTRKAEKSVCKYSSFRKVWRHKFFFQNYCFLLLFFSAKDHCVLFSLECLTPFLGMFL